MAHQLISLLNQWPIEFPEKVVLKLRITGRTSLFFIDRKGCRSYPSGGVPAAFGIKVIAIINYYFMNKLSALAAGVSLACFFLPLQAAPNGGQVKLYGIEGQYVKKPDGTIYLYPSVNTFIPSRMDSMSGMSGMSGMSSQQPQAEVTYPPPPGLSQMYRYTAPPQRYIPAPHRYRPNPGWFPQNQHRRPRPSGAYPQNFPHAYGGPSFGAPWDR